MTSLSNADQRTNQKTQIDSSESLNDTNNISTLSPLRDTYSLQQCTTLTIAPPGYCSDDSMTTPIKIMDCSTTTTSLRLYPVLSKAPPGYCSDDSVSPFRYERNTRPNRLTRKRLCLTPSSTDKANTCTTNGELPSPLKSMPEAMEMVADGYTDSANDNSISQSPGFFMNFLNDESCEHFPPVEVQTLYTDTLQMSPAPSGYTSSPAGRESDTCEGGT